jgi:hypothetical protein
VVIYDVRPSSSRFLRFFDLTFLYSPPGPVRFSTRGDRHVSHVRTFFCSLFPAREAHHAPVRNTFPGSGSSFLDNVIFSCACIAVPTEISSQTISYSMNAVMPTLPTSTLPSIILNGAYLLAWLGPWPIWLQKFSTSAATLTPLIGGRSVFVLTSLFSGADPSAAVRTPLSRTAFPKTRCVFLRMPVRSVVAQGLPLSGRSVLSSHLHRHISLNFFLSHLAPGQGSFQTHCM